MADSLYKCIGQDAEKLCVLGKSLSMRLDPDTFNTRLNILTKGIEDYFGLVKLCETKPMYMKEYR